MTVYALFFEKTPFLDNNGNPLSGGKIYTYTAGSSSAKNTYTEADGLTANPNPIILNSRGEVPNGIYGTTGAYKLVLQDSLGATIWTRDNVTGINDVGSSASEWQSTGLTATYVAWNQFSVVGDQTSTFHAGRRLKMIDGVGTKYGCVSAAVFSAGITTVTAILDSGLIAATLSSVQVGLLRADYPSFPLQQSGLLNKIINGAMRFDQRNGGASQTFTAGAALAYCVDRWYGYCTGANLTGQYVMTSGQARYRFTGAASVTSLGFGQRIEYQNSAMLAEKTATLQAKLSSSSLSSVSWLAYYANTADAFGTLAAPTKTLIASGTFNISATEQTYTTNIAIPAAATTGIEIVFTAGALLAGQTLTIGDVQLTESGVAPYFEQRPFGLEFSLCQRYFEGGNAAIYGYAGAGGISISASVPFKATKRAVPTMGYASGTIANVSTFDARSPQLDSFLWFSASAAAGGTAWVGSWTANAEL